MLLLELIGRTYFIEIVPLRRTYFNELIERSLLCGTCSVEFILLSNFYLLRGTYYIEFNVWNLFR